MGINLSSVFVQNRFQWCGCNVEQFYLHRTRALRGEERFNSEPDPDPDSIPNVDNRCLDAVGVPTLDVYDRDRS